MTNFLSPESLRQGGPRRLGIQLERLLWHLDFSDVRHIDGAGDGGGDVLAVRGSELWVFQNKWTSGDTTGRDGIDDAERAKAKYAADRAVLVTNAVPSKDALTRKQLLARVGVNIEIWSGPNLARLFDAIPSTLPARFSLRPYQKLAVAALQRDLAASNRALLILATGLGKTIVAGEVIEDHLRRFRDADILVVAHMKELVRQLERALWRHIPKGTRTQVLTGDDKPSQLSGVTCATVESALSAAYDGYRPNLVIVDETHHVAESGMFQRLLDLLDRSPQVGVTATPWRGDSFDITRRFGPASFKMGIAEGMAQGFLAQVDYRLFADNIDWHVVHAASQRSYTVRELNKSLFIPARDEAVVDHLVETWSTVKDARAIVFCQSVEHADRFAQLLARASPNWRRAASLHSRKQKRDREVLMSDFKVGRVPIITACDVLNEGVDVPDVNMICFLRVTHSRRIFVQQLGRGLRLRDGKESVVVLDFVSDIRRIAATLDLRKEIQRLRNVTETVHLSAPALVRFSSAAVESLMTHWIRDAADLETAADEARLQFPDLPPSVF